MRDPGNPRKVDPDPSSHSAASDTDSLTSLVELFIRFAGAVVLFVVLLAGAYYATTAFARIGQFITKPGAARESIQEMADLIDAERLGFQPTGNPGRVEPGKLIATIVWLGWHL